MGDPLNGWSTYFQEISRLLEDADRQYGVANNNRTDYILERLEMTLGTCSDLLHHIREQTEAEELEEYVSSLRELIDCIKVIYRKWAEYQTILDSSSESQNTLSYRATRHSSGPGRPKFQIGKDQLEYLSSLGFKWNEIAALLGVSRMTVYRRRLEYGLINDPSTDISDVELISEMKAIRQNTPYCGVSMMYGSLRARGMKVTRERVRTSLRSIDPIGSALRWPAGPTKRRPYSVAGPNSLWHIDSHHKLIRWRLVTHGGIDGYSRLIVYLRCSSNNRAATLYELFLSAIHKHNLPSRVRSDEGQENITVAHHMLENRGNQRRSMITGCSVHNQRIERLWRDMHRSVTVLYYKLFYFMEHHGILDHLNEHHLWAFHYVFVPRINRALGEFVNSWNNHPIRTAGHKSPQQLFTAGALLQHSQLIALDFFDNVDSDYGTDPDGPIPAEEEETGVSVPQTNLKFTDTDMAILQQNIDPRGATENYGLDLYEQTLQYITSLTPI